MILPLSVRESKPVVLGIQEGALKVDVSKIRFIGNAIDC